MSCAEFTHFIVKLPIKFVCAGSCIVLISPGEFMACTGQWIALCIDRG